MNKLYLRNYILAGSKEARDTQLKRLAAHESKSVRRRVAENCRCPRKILATLACDQAGEVRMAVALNKQTDLSILMRLSSDPNPDVRYMIASTSYVPPAALERLSRDENPYVHCRARKTLDRLRKLRLGIEKTRAAS